MNLSLEGRNIVVMGVANKRSIAWGIARSLHNAGARLIFTYVGERLEKSVKELADPLERNDSIVLPCDVTNDQEIETCFADIKKKYGVIHGIAHASLCKQRRLVGEYLNTNREGFLFAHNISPTFTAVAKAARGIMTEGGSIVTLTYLGGERVVSNYNVMGVAKASLDASVKYLASDFGT